MASVKFHNSFRKYHRWLGYFLAGIMAVYSVSGVLLIFRKTDFLKYNYSTEKQLSANLDSKSLEKTLGIRNFSVLETTAEKVVFTQGYYEKSTGLAVINKKDYPATLAKMVKLHKATTGSPLFILNISFGLGLLFFVISSFLMFMPKNAIFRNGIKVAGIGFLFALIVVLFGS
ncbi:PepSY domain-containing protein [Paraglaciecola aquimarina]|uniref:PepSY domain-containing protein n=1 Tax=Paraglaciecola aquimarina TaxID=1235557 RepID=A0ABU3SZP4_9ALTE|nr:PepSY domain-containing protein [Paraglaciecola aquimarina]MDU0355479.1 PepSY domain-containing protein [Paraglaciecola aquimarina]